MHRRVIGLVPQLRGAAMLAAFALVAACGSDSSTGVDNTPASVAANVTTPASAVIASPVNPPPSVVVKNAAGEPLPNVRVTFVITAGDGDIAGGSQLTDSDGVATVGGWTLGVTPGMQTLTATAGGQTVNFTINATNSCALTGALAAGATVSGDLTASPCAMGDGRAAQSWTFTQSGGQGAVSFEMHPTGARLFDTVLLLHQNTFSAFDRIVALNDDDTTVPANTTTNSRMDVILAPGTYVVSGVNFDAGITGPFSVTANDWSGEFSGCSDVFVTPGITTTQRMDSSCHYEGTNSQNVDPVWIYASAGQRIQFDMSSAVFDPALDYNGLGSDATTIDDVDGTTSARLVLTAPEAGLYPVIATSRTVGQVGAYTLTVTLPGSAPVGPAAAPSARAHAAPGFRKGVRASARRMVPRAP